MRRIAPAERGRLEELLKVRVRAWSVISINPLSVARVERAVAPPPLTRDDEDCLV
jgi:hypothetical protein